MSSKIGHGRLGRQDASHVKQSTRSTGQILAQILASPPLRGAEQNERLPAFGTAEAALVDEPYDNIGVERDELLFTHWLAERKALAARGGLRVERCVDAALGLVEEFGWSTFPARFKKEKDGKVSKRSWKSSKDNGNNWGHTSDPQEIEQNYKDFPKAGVGVPAGPLNDVFDVETDTKAGHGKDANGAAILATLEREHGKLPETLSFISPTGSVHRLFRWPKLPAGTTIKSRDAITGEKGLDVIGDGGMFVAPPSVRPGKGVYRWINYGTPIADAPAWLIALVTTREAPAKTGEPDEKINPAQLAFALTLLSNKDVDWETWNCVGMSCFANGDTDEGFEAFDAWSRKSSKYDAAATEKKWNAFRGSPRKDITGSTILWMTNEEHPGWLGEYEAKVQEDIRAALPAKGKQQNEEGEPEGDAEGEPEGDAEDDAEGDAEDEPEGDAEDDTPRSGKFGFSLGTEGIYKGRPLPTQANIKIALRHLGVTVKHNVFEDRSIINGLKGFELLNDPAVDRLWLTIDQKFKFKPTREFFYTVIGDLARRNSFHPVRDYLDALKWDGEKRIDTWLTDYASAKDTPLTRAVGALMLVAGVRRIRQPGCKFDEMPVLQSEQGLNKSTALQTLAVNPEWFSDDLPLGAESKKMIEHLKGRWIIEAAELNGMRKSDVTHLKSFLSRTIDRARMSYDRLPNELKRQCIIVGTTNDEKFLRDQTGNRRYWPMVVGNFDLIGLKADRDQLWAEAAEREAQGVSIRLPQELWGKAAIEQKKRTIDEPWIELIENELGNVQGKFLAYDIWSIVNVAPEQRTQAHNERISVAMKACGWRREKARFEKLGVKWAYVRGPKPYKLIKSVTTATASGGFRDI